MIQLCAHPQARHDQNGRTESELPKEVEDTKHGYVVTNLRPSISRD
jgi:hypothetical protein